MERKLYKIPIFNNKIPRWKCPRCQDSILQLEKDTFFKDETSDSKKAKAHDAWEPEWIEYTFSCILKCSNESCGEKVKCTGNGSVDWEVEYDSNGQQEQAWFDMFYPKFFVPHLKIFQYPDNIPENASKEIEESFELFFCNPSSASNHLRVALEHLLTHWKVKQYQRSGKRNPISLHKRIELLGSKFEDLKELLYAIKWLGNAGSHSSKVITTDDVLDAYEILEEVLNEVFVKKQQKIKKLAQKINKKKGPKSKT